MSTPVCVTIDYPVLLSTSTEESFCWYTVGKRGLGDLGNVVLRVHREAEGELWGPSSPGFLGTHLLGISGSVILFLLLFCGMAEVECSVPHASQDSWHIVLQCWWGGRGCAFLCGWTSGTLKTVVFLLTWWPEHQGMGACHLPLFNCELDPGVLFFWGVGEMTVARLAVARHCLSTALVVHSTRWGPACSHKAGSYWELY